MAKLIGLSLRNLIWYLFLLNKKLTSHMGFCRAIDFISLLMSPFFKLMCKYSALIFLILVVSTSIALAQDQTPAVTDTAKILNEVVIHAYAYNRPVTEVPAAVATVNEKELERFSNTSFLPAVNSIPGVRMEERSPGSYRFSIRGSLLRSPFGVRNVKFYWRGLPFTDGGGNTYLNLLDFSSVGNMEIIKGPGSSLYGAGTGGTVLLQPHKELTKNAVRVGMLGGSYGTYQFLFNVGSHVGRTTPKADRPGFYLMAYGGMTGSHGYRDQTRMGRLNAT